MQLISLAVKIKLWHCLSPVSHYGLSCDWSNSTNVKYEGVCVAHGLQMWISSFCAHSGFYLFVFDLEWYLTETARSAVFRKREEQKPALDNGSERRQNVGSRSVTEGKDTGLITDADDNNSVPYLMSQTHSCPSCVHWPNSKLHCLEVHFSSSRHSNWWRWHWSCN